MNNNKWVQSIIIALVNLGGQGSLEEIYVEVEKQNKIDLATYKDWKSQIRKNIYIHSSDCEIYKSDDIKNDLFYSVEGKGYGSWGLRISVLRHFLK